MKCLSDFNRNRRFYNSRRRCFLVAFIVSALMYNILPILQSGYTIWIGSHYDSDFDSQIGIGNIDKILRDNLPNNQITVLIWTTYWGKHEPVRILNSDKCSFLKHRLNNRPNASVFDVPCRISFDRRYLDVADALVFHSTDLIWDRLPSRRHPHQRWVYYQGECPIYTLLNLQSYPDTFNWTMTYRRDSDVHDPYGLLVPLSTSDPTNSSNDWKESVNQLVKKKTRLVAWIVSSCDSHSKREYFVEELQKYLTIDIYGWCGDKCPPGNCYSYVQPTHKFYLSFENALCTDYITEKFFEALKSDMVPIVYGGTQSEDYSSVAPNHSYIDSRSFDSPKDLANYLLYLDKHDEEYMKYFEWKKKYKVSKESIGFCNLCQRLYELSNGIGFPDRKSYKDIWRWWNYASYDENIEKGGNTDVFSEISESYQYKLDGPICLAPPMNLIVGARGTPDFEPGFRNGKIFGKWMDRAKELIF